MHIDPKKEEEIHRIQISITQSVFDLCEKHGIRCFLVGGSLLGAVKEKKVISGDKDVDIGMLREDYEKFCKVANQLPENLYFLEARTDQTYHWLFAKVCKRGTRLIPQNKPLFGPVVGIYADIIPYDFISEDEGKRKAEFRRAKLKKWFMLLKGKPSKSNWKLMLLSLLGKMQSRNKLIQYFANNRKQTGFVQNLVGGTENDWFTVQEIMDIQTVTLSGHSFLAPRYNRYLDLNYSDWKSKDMNRTELDEYRIEYE